jgi:hypothetical protein
MVTGTDKIAAEASGKVGVVITLTQLRSSLCVALYPLRAHYPRTVVYKISCMPLSFSENLRARGCLFRFVWSDTLHRQTFSFVSGTLRMIPGVLRSLPMSALHWSQCRQALYTDRTRHHEKISSSRSRHTLDAMISTYILHQYRDS